MEKKVEKHVEVLDMLEDLNRINVICEKIAKKYFDENIADQNRKREQGSL